MSQAVCITGGSRGIGRAMVRAFAGAGYQVMFSYLQDRTAAASLVRELERDGLTALPVQADVSCSEQVRKLAEKGERHLGGIDILVNNAGIASRQLLIDLEEPVWDRILDVNLKAVYLCCKAFLPYMIRKKQGVILNISSMWGQVGASCEAAYSAAKAGVIGLTKALAKEMGPSGIRVDCIAPGVVDTDMLGELSPPELEALREDTPLESIGKPEDIAAAALFLASDRARFITGQVLGVNGGFII